MPRAIRWTCVVVGLIAASCDTTDTTGPIRDRDPRDLFAVSHWVFQQFDEGTPLGYPSVELSWELPRRHRDEPFRVYARDASRRDYRLIATVTSCIEGICRYTDTNVVTGETYDYYIATVDERTGSELGISDAIRVDVLGLDLDVPATPTVTSLDGAAFIEWTATGADLYTVQVRDGTGADFVIGETDGTRFYDERAENGAVYYYSVAAKQLDGRVSFLSEEARAIPRPDFFSDVVYADADLPASSGFRFVTNETDDPIVSGDSPLAQWRLIAEGGLLQIEPLGQTAITSGTFTTELTCGPASDATCEDLSVAPAASAFGSAPVDVQTGSTYVLRVLGSDNRVHYAKLRVQGNAVDTEGRRLIVFDWAYQLRADEPALNRVR